MADTGARSPTASSGLTYLAANMYDGNATTAGGIIKVGGGTTSDCTFSAIAGSDIPAGATINGVQWAFNASAIVFFSYENTSLIDLKLSLDGGSNFSSALGTINLTSTLSVQTMGGATELWGLDWSGFTDISQLVLKFDVDATDGSGWYFPLIREVTVTVYYTEGAAGYSHSVSGIASANISSVNGIATANISKINGI